MSTPRGSNATARSFHLLAKDFHDETFERFPIRGSEAGLSRFHDRLGRMTPSVMDRQIKLARKTLAAIDAMPIHAFEGNDRLDRLTLQSALRSWLATHDEMACWRTNPQIPLEDVADSIYGLLVRHADDLRPVAAAIVSRVKEIPRYLDGAAECIRKPVPLWVDLAKASADGVCSLLRSLPDELSKASRHDPRTLDRWSTQAAAAVRNYVRRIARRKPGPESGFSLGTERFERLIRGRLGMNLTAREAVASAHGLAESLKASMKAEARRFHRRKSAPEILEEAARSWEFQGENLLAAYTQSMADVRDRFQSADVVTFPKRDRLLVRQVPDFMIHQFPTAAYSSPGPLDRNQTGIFWVNDLGRHRKTEKEKRAEVAQHFGLELTSAHEAYPGHHLQFVTQHRHPSLVRKMADHAIYYEGWTLWCEQMSVDLKISDNPYLKLIQLHDAHWRAQRIIIDCGLQTGALSYGGACRRLQQEVGFTAARARADVNWYTSSPTVPMSYLLGKMELLRLKRQRVDRGDWTLKQFNDWVLSFGAIPWSWIESSGL